MGGLTDLLAARRTPAAGLVAVAVVSTIVLFAVPTATAGEPLRHGLGIAARRVSLVDDHVTHLGRSLSPVTETRTWVNLEDIPRD